MFERVITEWYGSIYEVVETIKNKGVVLCGAGKWSKYATRILKLFDVEPECICGFDDEAYDSILTIDQAIELYPQSVYISSADTPSSRNEWNLILKDRGVLSKESGVVFWRYAFLLDFDIETLNHRSMVRHIKSEDIKNILLFNHMFHSGSGYFQEMIDFHPNILSVLTLSASWREIYKNRLRHLAGQELCVEICAQMAKYFDTSVGRNGGYPQSTTLSTFEGMYLNKNGDFDWGICIKPDEFYAFLMAELSYDFNNSFASVLKAIFAAYNNCLHRSITTSNLWMAYDLHDPSIAFSDFDEFDLDKEFDRVKCVYLVRNPFRHLRAMIKAYAVNASTNLRRFMLYSDMIIRWLRAECGECLNDDGKEAYVIRFEDMKENHRAVMDRVCELLGIPFADSMESTSINGRNMYLRTESEQGGVLCFGTLFQVGN